MTDNLQETLAEILKENGLTEPISNRLLMAMLIDIRDGVRANTATLDTVCEQIEGHEQRIATLETERAASPSLTWLLKNDTKATLKTIAIILIVLTLLMGIGQPLAFWIIALLGLPLP